MKFYSHACLYGMYFVSKFNALGKDIDYRECNGFKVSLRKSVILSV